MCDAVEGNVLEHHLFCICDRLAGYARCLLFNAIDSRISKSSFMATYSGLDRNDGFHDIHAQQAQISCRKRHACCLDVAYLAWDLSHN